MLYAIIDTFVNNEYTLNECYKIFIQQGVTIWMIKKKSCNPLLIFYF